MTYKTGSEQWDILINKTKQIADPPLLHAEKKTERIKERRNANAGSKKETNKHERVVTIAKREDIMFFDGHANEVEYHGRRIVNGNAVTDAN